MVRRCKITMLSIKDYLNLIAIREYFSEEIDKKELENNGYSNLEIDNLIVMRNNLYTIITKLEKE